MKSVGDLLAALHELASDYEEMGLGELGAGIQSACRLICDNFSNDDEIGSVHQSDNNDYENQLNVANKRIERLLVERARLRTLLGKYEANIQRGIPAISDFFAKKLAYDELRHPHFGKQFAYSQLSLQMSAGACSICHGSGKYPGIVSRGICAACDGFGVDFDTNAAIPELLKVISDLRHLVMRQDATIWQHVLTSTELREAEGIGVEAFYSDCRSNYRGD